MLFALLLLAGAADWIPMRWTSSDPKTLELLKGTPINCILLEKQHWSPPLLKAAADSSIATLAVVRPVETASADAQQAIEMKFDGVVLEGNFEANLAQRIRSTVADSKRIVIDLPPRSKMRFDARPIVGTYQGVWPGVQIDEGGSAKAAPSGAPWINTNSGFLRFVRAAAPEAAVWMGNIPPANTVITGERYLQVIADSAIVGGRWIVAFDEDFSKRLYAREAPVLADWKKITEQIAYFEEHSAWRALKPLGLLALVQDADSGALLSGGVLDMIAVKHAPIRAVPTRMLKPEAIKGARIAVNVDPGSLNDAQREALRSFARDGNRLLSGPADWKFPAPTPEQITLSEDDVKTLDEIWKQVNAMSGWRSLGARLFNVSSMLSNLLETDKGAVLHLVNYSGYPVENVTVHLMGKYKSATLMAPGQAAKKIEIYDNEEGTGVEIPGIGVMGTVILE